MMGPKRRGRRRDPWRRRVVLGLTAIAAVGLIGYIAYTANTGLPFQSAYDVSVYVPNADRLIDTADVRIGGVRVGEVVGLSAVSDSSGQRPYSRIKISLSPSIGRLPIDSGARVRPASVLGLTYLDLTLGHSRRTVPAGGALPLSRAKPSSDLTDLFTIFDRSSSRRFQATVGDMAYGLAGRGAALNTTIHAVNRLLPALTDVAAALAAPSAQLADFLRAYETTVSALAPVGVQLASLISNAATTLNAVAQQRDALAATLEQAPTAESAATRAFVAVRPALDGLAQLVVDLRPAGARLPVTLPQINSTLAAGLPPLRQIPSFSPYVGRAFTALQTLSRDSNTVASLRKLTDLAGASRGALSLLVPAQVNCNVISLFTSGFAGVFGTLGTGEGPSLGALFLSETGAAGEAVQNARPSPNVGINPIPNESQNGCEAGNEPWTGGQQLGNPPGPQSKTTRPTVPPPGVEALAQQAGLITAPAGLR
jgi:virulence factor Mce-like protein